MTILELMMKTKPIDQPTIIKLKKKKLKTKLK